MFYCCEHVDVVNPINLVISLVYHGWKYGVRTTPLLTFGDQRLISSSVGLLRLESI